MRARASERASERASDRACVRICSCVRACVRAYLYKCAYVGSPCVLLMRIISRQLAVTAEPWSHSYMSDPGSLGCCACYNRNEAGV